jgi:hypothetical protein
VELAKQSRGPRGLVGKQGAPGPQGAQGARGPIGPTMKRADVLAMVDDQFVSIRQELSLQFSRLGQIQVQLDQIHTMLKKLSAHDLD